MVEWEEVPNAGNVPSSGKVVWEGWAMSSELLSSHSPPRSLLARQEGLELAFHASTPLSESCMHFVLELIMNFSDLVLKPICQSLHSLVR